MSNGSMSFPHAYAKNSSIKIDGTSLEQYKGLEDKQEIYIGGIVRVLDVIWSRPLGRVVIEAVGGPLALNRTVRITPFHSFRSEDILNPDVRTWYHRGGPWQTKVFEFGENAFNTPPGRMGSECVIQFSKEAFSDLSKPGSSADELLLHEFLHMFDDFEEEYADSRDGNFQFDGTDFLTVTATNIYAASAREPRRPLRNDHRGFSPIHPRFAKSDSDYATLFWENIARFRRVNPKFHRALVELGPDSAWNPFRRNTATSVVKYKVVVRPKKWEWKFILFMDGEGGRAYWEDAKATHQFGFGKWRKNGDELIVSWDTEGSWDIIKRDSYSSTGTLRGRTKTGGEEYDTEVTWLR